MTTLEPLMIYLMFTAPISVLVPERGLFLGGGQIFFFTMSKFTPFILSSNIFDGDTFFRTFQ